MNNCNETEMESNQGMEWSGEEMIAKPEMAATKEPTADDSEFRDGSNQGNKR